MDRSSKRKPSVTAADHERVVLQDGFSGAMEGLIRQVTPDQEWMVAACSRVALRDYEDDLEYELADNMPVGEKEPVLKEAPDSFIHSKWFGGVVTSTICANAIMIGVETDYPLGDHPGNKTAYKIFEHGFTGIFFVEMILKLGVLRKYYFFDGWNLFDFFLVWMSVIDSWIIALIVGDNNGLRGFSLLRMLRLLRIARMVRLVKIFRELWLIVKGMIDSVKTIFWASSLLVMLLYVGGIFFTQTIGRNNMYYSRYRELGEPEVFIDYHPDYDAYEQYGTLLRAMFTLFETCFEPLNLRPVVERQPLMMIFFIAFAFLTTFGMMNVIVGVIVERCMAASSENDVDQEEVEMAIRMRNVPKIRDACFQLDTDGNGFITFDEVQQALANPEIAECLSAVRLPIGTEAEDFFDLIDSEGTGQVTLEQLMRNLLRTLVHDDRRNLLELKAKIHRLQRAAREQAIMHKEHFSRLTGLEHELSADGGFGNLETRLSGILHACNVDCEVVAPRNDRAKPLAQKSSGSEYGRCGSEDVVELRKEIEQFDRPVIPVTALI